jgi:hypothetical protein
MTAQQDLEIMPFSKFIGALDPWLKQVVLIGGWAHRWYRRIAWILAQETLNIFL